ncbi:hypothetical protein MIR68_012617, partial [Amoeboaphelidium protococcarum]
ESTHGSVVELVVAIDQARVRFPLSAALFDDVAYFIARGVTFRTCVLMSLVQLLAQLSVVNNVFVLLRLASRKLQYMLAYYFELAQYNGVLLA